MTNKITTKNFSETNRSRVIGNSLYKICEDYNFSKWYIHEIYNDGKNFSIGKGYFNSNLKEVIDKINSFCKEKEIVNLNIDEDEI